MSYDLGNDVIISGMFRDRGGVPKNPSVVTITVKPPGSASQVIPVSSTDVVGKWEGTYTPPTSGTYWFRVEGSGAVVAASEGTFVMNKRRVT